MNILIHRVPLTVRMLFYGAFFLSIVLIACPWLAYRIDERMPGWRIDVGPIRFMGVGIFVCSLGLYVRTSWFLSRRGNGAYVEFDPPTTFVAEGPYRWVRNPIAACVVGMLLGEAIAFSSVGIFLLFLLSVPAAHLQVVLLEEPLLKKRFGQAYEAYLAEVPRWLPRRPSKGVA